MIHKVRILKPTDTDSYSSDEMILNKSDSDFLLDDEGINVDKIVVNQSTYSANSIPGEIVDEITYQKGRNIDIIGWIVDEPSGSMRIKKQKLHSFFSPELLYRLDFGDRYIDAYPKNPVTFGTKYKDNNDKFCKFSISFFAPYPFFKSKVAVKYYPIVDPVSPLTDSDMENPEVVDGLVGVNGIPVSYYMQMAEIDNPSDVSVGFTMRIKLAPPQGAMPAYHGGIRVQNTRTSEYFQVKDGLLSGTFELCTIPKKRGFWKISSPPRQSALSGYDSGSNFFSLKPGKNSIATRFPYYPEIVSPQQYMWIKSIYYEFYPEYFYVDDEVM